MLFNRFPNLNHRSQKLFTRIRQIRQLPLHFPKNCVRIRQTCISMRRVPRAQRGECLAFSAPLERRLCIFTQLNGASKNRDRPSAQKNTAILTSQPSFKCAFGKKALYFHSAERRVKKQRSTVCSNQHSHSHLTAKRHTRRWKDSCLFQPNRMARQNADSHRSQTNTAILTSQPNVKRAVDDAFLQQNQGKRRRKCPPAPAPFAFKEIH